MYQINYFSKISSQTASLILTAYEAIKSWLLITLGHYAEVAYQSSLLIGLETVLRKPYKLQGIFQGLAWI